MTRRLVLSGIFLISIVWGLVILLACAQFLIAEFHKPKIEQIATGGRRL